MFIPELGTKITNPADWRIEVIAEDRNKSLFEAQGMALPGWQSYGKPLFNWTFPKDSIFQVDRIYVRKGNEAFSSISLLILETTHPKMQKTKIAPFTKSVKMHGRFFCSLSDFNKAGFLLVK